MRRALRRVARRALRRALPALALALGAPSAAAQLPSAGRVPPNAVTEPSRAQALLAAGRLAAAEQELYAAVEANPRQSAPRGELARYLASRGRFRIAEVLLDEALRFGADPAIVARALAEMAPYRAPSERRAIPGLRLPGPLAARERERAARGWAEAVDGAETTVAMTMTEDGRTLLRLEVATEAGRAWATVDPRMEGLAVASAEDPAVPVRAFGARGNGAPVLVPELRVGARTLRWLDAYVDPSVPAGEVRIGIDLFWRLRAIVDERAGTLTLPPAAARPPVPASAVRIPMLLGFPGLQLVERPGLAPVAIEGAEGRALLRGGRWTIDPEAATVDVVR